MCCGCVRREMLLCVVCLIRRIRRCVEGDRVERGGVGCHGGEVVSISC